MIIKAQCIPGCRRNTCMLRRIAGSERPMRLWRRSLSPGPESTDYYRTHQVASGWERRRPRISQKGRRRTNWSKLAPRWWTSRTIKALNRRRLCWIRSLLRVAGRSQRRKGSHNSDWRWLGPPKHYKKTSSRNSHVSFWENYPGMKWWKHTGECKRCHRTGIRVGRSPRSIGSSKCLRRHSANSSWNSRLTRKSTDFLVLQRYTLHQRLVDQLGSLETQGSWGESKCQPR